MALENLLVSGGESLPSRRSQSLWRYQIMSQH